MKTMSQILMMFLAVLVFMSTSSAAKASCHSSINVTTTVYDSDSSSNQLLLRSDDWNGTGYATYSAALNANVVSDIYGCDGRWYFELYRQSVVRTLYITPNDAINSSQPQAPPPGYYQQYVEVVSGCHDQNGNAVSFWSITTVSDNCDLIVDFGYGGTKYKLAMGSKWSLPGATTGLVTVTCKTVNTGSGECVSWTITPNVAASSGNNPTVANLYYYARGGKLTFIGQYYNTFRFDLNPY
jgi:hypothetical protein